MMTEAPHDVISFGPTLARQMSEAQQTEHFKRIPGDQLVGVIQIALVRSASPRVINVEAWHHGMPPQRSVEALRIAHDRLRKLHDLEAPRCRPNDAGELRTTAEYLVDLIRAGRILDVNLPIVRFDTSRENAVLAAMEALHHAADLRKPPSLPPASGPLGNPDRQTKIEAAFRELVRGESGTDIMVACQMVMAELIRMAARDVEDALAGVDQLCADIREYVRSTT